MQGAQCTVQVADELMAEIADRDIAAETGATTLGTSLPSVEQSISAEDAAAAMDVDSPAATTGGGHDTAMAEAAPSVEPNAVAVPEQTATAPQPSATAAEPEQRAGGATAQQLVSSEEVLVAPLDSIVGGELGKLDPVFLDTVPARVRTPTRPSPVSCLTLIKASAPTLCRGSDVCCLLTAAAARPPPVGGSWSGLAVPSACKRAASVVSSLQP